MFAKDFMVTTVLSVPRTATLRQIAKIMMDHEISGLPVVDDNGCPIGMVTESDLIASQHVPQKGAGRDWWLTQLAEGEPLSQDFIAYLDGAELTANDVMTTPVLSVAENTDIADLARLFISARIKRVPVMRDSVLVGIVSRADLVRQMAAKPTQAAPVDHGGVFSNLVASVDRKFGQHIYPHSAEAPARQAPSPPPVTAKAFVALMEEYGHKMARAHEQQAQILSEHRRDVVDTMIHEHIDDEKWRDILRRAQAAAEHGEKELLLLRFPPELCNDGGRAINAPRPEWPETLRGEAAELYLRWRSDLRPNGYQLTAKVIDFPNGFPGDIGLTLIWGG